MKKILLLLTLAILSSCYTTKKSLDHSVVIRDSLHITYKYVDSLIKVPGSYAPLVIIPKDMRDGEEKQNKSGQANVKVIMKRDTLYIEASCDSLDLIIKAMEMEINRLSQTNDNLKKDEEKKSETVETVVQVNKLIARIIGLVALGLFVFFGFKHK